MKHINGAMPKNRIRDLRKAKGLTSEQLAEHVGVSQPHISRLEGNKRLLLVPLAERIAGVLGVTTAEVLGLDADTDVKALQGFSEDVSPYVPAPGDPLAAFASQSHHLRTVENDQLDRVRIYRGDVLIIDISEARVKRVAPLDIVLVRFHPVEDFMKPLSLLRQFVPPRLLITNSSKGNLPMIDMDEEDAHIIGVVDRALRRPGT